MKEHIKRIMTSEDPLAIRAKKWDDAIAGKIKTITIVCMIVSIVIGLIVAGLIAEHYDGNSSITVNFFGLIFELDEDNFFASPFMVFAFVSAILDLLFSAVMLFLSILFEIHGVLMGVLNNSYRTMKLMEVNVCTQNGLELPKEEAQAADYLSKYRKQHNLQAEPSYTAIEQVSAKVLSLHMTPHPLNPGYTVNSVIFEQENGTHKEFVIDDYAAFETLVEGDWGILRHQGNRFIFFKSNS